MEKVVESVRLAIAGKEYDIEFKILDSNGNLKFLRERTKVIFHNDKVKKIIGIVQDLTEFKVVEENLRAFSKDLINAHRISGLGTWRFNFKENRFYSTDELYRIANVEPIEVKNGYEDLIKKAIHPKDQPMVLKVAENYKIGDSISLEFRVLQKDGSNKYVLVKGEPQYDKNGQVVEMFGIAQDITENKVLEEKLRKSYNIIAQAEALAHVGSWEIDVESKRLILSDEAMKIFGFDMNNFNNSFDEFLKIVHPDDLYVLQDKFKNPPDRPFNLEFRFIKPDGSIGYIEQRVDFVFNEENEPVLVYGTIQDITELKALENELIERYKAKIKVEKRFETLIQEANDVFEILDKDGTIIYISDAVERTTGYKVEEKLGKKAWEFFEGEEIEMVKNIIKEALSKPGERLSGDFVEKRKDGKVIYIEVNVQNLLDNPYVEGIVVNYRDITKRIKTE